MLQATRDLLEAVEAARMKVPPTRVDQFMDLFWMSIDADLKEIADRLRHRLAYEEQEAIQKADIAKMKEER